MPTEELQDWLDTIEESDVSQNDESLSDLWSPEQGSESSQTRDLGELLRLADKRCLGVLVHPPFTIDLKLPRLLLSHGEQYFPGAPVNAQKPELLMQVDICTSWNRWSIYQSSQIDRDSQLELFPHHCLVMYLHPSDLYLLGHSSH